MNKIKPIKPIEPIQLVNPCESDGDFTLPPRMIKIFNEAIKRNWDGNKSIISPKEAVQIILKEFELVILPINCKYVISGLSELSLNCILSVKSVYSQAGWIVEYNIKGFVFKHP
jgi:hypothetical protein